MNCTEDRKRERRGRKKNIVYKVYLVFLQKGIALSIRTPDHKYFFFLIFKNLRDCSICYINLFDELFFTLTKDR